MPPDESAAIEKELIGEVEAAINDVHDMDYDTVGLPESIQMLNNDQRRIIE